MIEKVQALLEPGEQVQVAVTGQTGLNPAWRWLTRWLIIANRPRIIAVTDRRIAVFKSGNWSRQTPRQLLYSLPRDTALSHTTHAWSKLPLGNEKVWVSRRTYGFIDAANGVAASQQPSAMQQPAAQQPVMQYVGAPQPQPQPQPQPVAQPQPQPQPQPQAEPVAVPAAAWHPDPTGRHELRYWDATAWTANVSDQGVVGLDPLS